MINLQVNTTELENFIRRLKYFDSKRLIEQYYIFLQKHVNIEAKLKEKINELVYSSSRKPDLYQWTGRLLQGVRCERNRYGVLELYMDDKWLEDNTGSKLSDETGWSPSAHGDGAGMSYSERVEYQYYFNDNILYPGGSGLSSATGYFQQTFNELKNVVDRVAKGQEGTRVLLEPLFRMWR